MRLFLKSFIYAFNGLKISLMQRNMKVMALCAFITILSGFFFGISITEWCIILICIGLVLSLEILNSAIESFVDLVQPEIHPIAGKVKDLAAAAVLLFSLICATIAVLIFGKYILALLPL